LEVALSVQKELENRVNELDRLHYKKVEQAKYERELARRRYMTVDPDNRLVADELEAEWNKRLKEHKNTQREYEQRRQQEQCLLQKEQKKRIMKLATQFPELWNDDATSDKDRKRMVNLIIEDVTNSEAVDNPDIRQKDRNWYYEVVSKIGDKNTKIDVVGTILHRDSLLTHISKNPTYKCHFYQSVISWSEREDLWEKWRDIFTNIDNENREAESDKFYEKNKKDMLLGTSVLWEERENYLRLMKEMVEIGKRAFMKEKQNKPMGAHDSLFEHIHWYRETETGIQIEKTGIQYYWADLKYSCCGVIDPATGTRRNKKNKAGDFTCILTGYSDPKGRLLIHHDYTKKVAPTKFISEIFELHELFDYQKFAVETNLYRNLLMPNLIEERKKKEKMRQKKIQIPFYDIDNTENKEKRIEMIEPKVTHGWILFNRALGREFINQIEDYPHSDHDDCPDAMEMLWRLHKGAYHASPLSVDVIGGR